MKKDNIFDKYINFNKNKKDNLPHISLLEKLYINLLDEKIKEGLDIYLLEIAKRYKEGKDWISLDLKPYISTRIKDTLESVWDKSWIMGELDAEKEVKDIYDKVGSPSSKKTKINNNVNLSASLNNIASFADKDNEVDENSKTLNILRELENKLNSEYKEKDAIKSKYAKYYLEYRLDTIQNDLSRDLKSNIGARISRYFSSVIYGEYNPYEVRVPDNLDEKGFREVSSKSLSKEQEYIKTQKKLTIDSLFTQLKKLYIKDQGVSQKDITEDQERIYNNKVKSIIYTELTAAYNIGRLKYFLKNNIKFVKWNFDREHFGRGVVCKTCAERFSIQAIPDFPTGVYPIEDALTNRELIIPLHPYCLCYWTAYNPTKNQILAYDKSTGGLKTGLTLSEKIQEAVKYIILDKIGDLGVAVGLYKFNNGVDNSWYFGSKDAEETKRKGMGIAAGGLMAALMVTLGVGSVTLLQKPAKEYIEKMVKSIPTEPILKDVPEIVKPIEVDIPTNIPKLLTQKEVRELEELRIPFVVEELEKELIPIEIPELNIRLNKREVATIKKVKDSKLNEFGEQVKLSLYLNKYHPENIPTPDGKGVRPFLQTYYNVKNELDELNKEYSRLKTQLDNVPSRKKPEIQSAIKDIEKQIDNKKKELLEIEKQGSRYRLLDDLENQAKLATTDEERITILRNIEKLIFESDYLEQLGLISSGRKRSRYLIETYKDTISNILNEEIKKLPYEQRINIENSNLFIDGVINPNSELGKTIYSKFGIDKDERINKALSDNILEYTRFIDRAKELRVKLLDNKEFRFKIPTDEKTVKTLRSLYRKHRWISSKDGVSRDTLQYKLFKQTSYNKEELTEIEQSLLEIYNFASKNRFRSSNKNYLQKLVQLNIQVDTIFERYLNSDLPKLIDRNRTTFKSNILIDYIDNEDIIRNLLAYSDDTGRITDHTVRQLQDLGYTSEEIDKLIEMVRYAKGIAEVQSDYISYLNRLRLIRDRIINLREKYDLDKRAFNIKAKEAKYIFNGQEISYTEYKQIMREILKRLRSNKTLEELGDAKNRNGQYTIYAKYIRGLLSNPKYQNKTKEELINMLEDELRNIEFCMKYYIAKFIK